MKNLWKIPISMQQGDGNIYVLFIIVVIMGISYFLVDGFVPFLNKKADNYKVVTLDTNESAQDKRSNLQLTTFTYKPTLAPIITPTPGVQTTCKDGTLAIFLILDRSSSMISLKPALVGATQSMKTALLQSSPNNAVSVVSFAGDSTLDLAFNMLSVNENQFTQVINTFTPKEGTSTISGNVLEDLEPQLEIARRNFPLYKRIVIFITDGRFDGDTSNVSSDVPRVRNAGNEVYFLRIASVPYSGPKFRIEAWASIPASNYVIDIDPKGTDFTTKLNQIITEECK